MADDWEVTEQRGPAGEPEILPDDASMPQIPAWVLERLALGIKCPQCGQRDALAHDTWETPTSANAITSASIRKR